MGVTQGLNGRSFFAIRSDLLLDLDARASTDRHLAARAYPEFRKAYAERARLLTVASDAIRADLRHDGDAD